MYRIEFENDRWTLYKSHGYKPILQADSHDALIDHVLALTQGKGAVVRFTAEGGVRELRVGDIQEDGL
ncbi:hypothetical protein [Pseudomonas sp. Z4-20]|uniref:hypothetical protein n=1 Tax=unclassified Pseudomonas TaxID=196821 RepID=UPI003DA874D9